MQTALHQGQRGARSAEFRAMDGSFLFGKNIFDRIQSEVESEGGGNGANLAFGANQFWLDQPGISSLNRGGE